MKSRSIRLKVRLTLRGERDEIMRYEAGVLHARVAAPPVDRTANRALIALLAHALDVSRYRLHLDSGEASRDKTVRVTGLPLDDMAARSAAAIKEIECRK